MLKRPRRLRESAEVRCLVRETRISRDSLIWPLFIREGKNICQEIPSLPGQFHYSPDRLREGVEKGLAAGVRRFLVFGIPEEKEETGRGAWQEDGVVQQGLERIRRSLGKEPLLITDVCLCEYTSHGHCGVLRDGRVQNDETLPLLAATARSHVLAGADMVAPSDMMDGRVRAIREELDREGFSQIPIMSYTAKYASAFYGPFREAAGSAPASGDRKGYQMDWHNRREAFREAILDEEEGADILMVKPALSYLDIIREMADHTRLPVAAYSVSGEYAMIRAAGASGLADGYALMCETAASVYRAGADILISYFAPELAEAVGKGDLG